MGLDFKEEPHGHLYGDGPKHIAQSTNHIVLSIPAIPEVATKPLSVSCPVSMAVLPEDTTIRALKVDSVPSPPTLAMMSGCATTIATHAITTDIKSVTSAGNLRTISNIVTIGTKISHHDMVNEERNAEERASISAGELPLWVKLTMKNTINAITNDGTVVMVM